MKIFKIAFVFICIIALWHFLKPKADHSKNNVLIVGTSLDYPPYEFIDKLTKDPAGLDIDLMNLIAERMNKKLQIVNMPFSSLLFSLIGGDIDIIAAGITPTQRREKILAFSRPYITTAHAKPLAIISKKINFCPKNISDLHHKKVAVATGYIADLEISKYPDIDIIRLDSPVDCFASLQIGSVDAVVAAQFNINTFLNKQSHADQFCIQELQGTNEICALAVNKNNKMLLDEINKTLQDVSQDGSLQIILNRWIV